MTKLEFIEFYKKQFDIQKTNNSYWLLRQNKSAISFPTDENVFPTNSDFKLLFKQKIRIIAFKTELNEPTTFEFIYEGSDYTIEKFESKVRNQIRKGLKSCEIRTPDLETMKNEGLKINQLILQKHNRFESFLGEKQTWENYLNLLYNQKDIQVFGAFCEGKLAAYCVFMKIESKYFIYHPFMNNEFSASNPIIALLYTFINRIIEIEGKIEISYGLASYLEKSGLDKFKKNMLFSEKPVCRIIVIHPLYKLFINKFFCTFLKILFKLKIVKSSIYETYLFFVNSQKSYKKYIESL